ncbi:MAG: hypothetical protein AAGA32_14960, partial [Pseudomonadota bacterium]
SPVDLQTALNRFIEGPNETEATPFIRRADPNEITAARNRGGEALGAHQEHGLHALLEGQTPDQAC